MHTSAFSDHIYSPFALEEIRYLPAIPHICGYENVFGTSSYDVNGRKKGFRHRVMFQYTIKGCGLLELRGKSYKISQNKAMLLEIPDDFRYRMHPDSERWELMFVAFNDGLSIQICKDLMKEFGYCLQFEDKSKTAAALQKVYETMKGTFATDPFAVSRAGYDFLMTLVQELRSTPAENSSYSVETQIRAYCMKHIDRKITVEELAAHCGFSRFYFSRMIKRKTGVSPIDYIIQFKLRLAEQMLVHGSNISIKELAASCGFEDHSYFCRAFKQRYKLSPKQYAKTSSSP